MSTEEYKQFRAGKTSEVKRLELQAKSFEGTFSKQINLLRVRNGSKILDAGCGTGSFARLIAPIVAPERVIAVDIDPMFIQEAKNLAQKEGRNNIEFQVGNIENLDSFQREFFDVSYCRLVLPHLNDQVKGISELTRVTRKGGIIASSDEGDVFTYPSIDSFFGLFGKIAQWRRATQSQTSSKKQTTSELFKALGLRDIRIFPIPNFASNSENREKLRNFAATPIQMIDMYKEDVISKGFMSESEYQEGLQELNNWLERPEAFWMILTIFTIGTV